MQPYMNPYYFQNNQAFQQQQMYNPMAPYQDRLAQLQSQYNQQPPYNQMAQQSQTVGLNGEVVDSIDVVKAKNVDMSGNVTFYPKSDMTEIFTKQLMPDGTSRIVTYRAVQPEHERQQDTQQYVTIQNLNDVLVQFKNDLIQNIANNFTDIKQMISQSETQQKSQRGGNQK